jgi:ParB-like chromosome segregation protein Spo0J
VHDVAVLHLGHEHDRVVIDVIKLLPVSTIWLDLIHHGFLRRGNGMDDAHVKALSEVVNFRALPPVLVQRDGLRVIDGAHRLAAAKARGEKFIRARVVNCTDEDAYLLAVTANTLYGLPLSRADSVRGARRILDWHPDWPDRAIASATGLSTHTVSRLRQAADRAALLAGHSSEDGGRHRPATALGGRHGHG